METARLQRELQTTKEYLQSIIEEQEATNEELKSANEEVLSSNEELQSTNEELETAKEELQSTNEELVTVNEQLQNRNTELSQLSDDLSNLLASVNIPVVILGIDRHIRRYTPPAEKLLNLLPSDLGRPISNIRPNIQIPDLAELIGEVIDTVSLRERDVQDSEGRWYSMRIRPYRTLGQKIDGVVIIFIEVNELKQTQLALQREQSFVAAVLESAGVMVMVTDTDGRIVRFNRACQQVSGCSFEELKGRHPWEVLVPSEEIQEVKALYRELPLSRSPREDENHWLDRRGGRHLLSWTSTNITDEQGAVQHVIRVGVDVTERRRAEEDLEQSNKALEQSQMQLKTLARGLVEAQEEERRGVSRELHDDINQTLAALAIEIEMLQREPPASRDLLCRKLRLLQKRVETLSDNIRQTAYRLHPSIIEQLGLGPALESYCGEFSKKERIKVRLARRDLHRQIPHKVALSVYRVVQEALRNVAKHSGAARAQVTLAGRDDSLHVSVRDNGSGFSPAGAKGKGLGLIGMDERVRQVDGTLSIASKPGGGTRIDIRVPLAKTQKRQKV